VSANRELTGLGAANLGAGFCSGMVVNGSLSKTAVNGAAGAKTQLSGLAVTVLTVLTLLFLTGLFQRLPEATLAAVVIAAVVELVDISSLRRLCRCCCCCTGYPARTSQGWRARGMRGSTWIATPGSTRTSTASSFGSRPGSSSPTATTSECRSNGCARPRPASSSSTRRPARSSTSPAAQMLAQLAARLRQDGIELRIARDIGQFRDVMHTAVPDDFSHSVFRTVDEALSDGTPRHG
jgi:hypothetical protein